MLVITEHQPPYSYVNGNTIGGVSAELVRKTFDHAGISYRHKLLPWKRGFELTLKRKNTFLSFHGENTEREHRFKWIGPLLSSEFKFYKLKRRQDIEEWIARRHKTLPSGAA